MQENPLGAREGQSETERLIEIDPLFCRQVRIGEVESSMLTLIELAIASKTLTVTDKLAIASHLSLPWMAHTPGSGAALCRRIADGIRNWQPAVAHVLEDAARMLTNAEERRHEDHERFALLTAQNAAKTPRVA